MTLKLSGQLKATATVIAIASGSLLANSASANENIKLKSRDGVIDLVGKIVEFSNNSYVLRTPTGELNISARHVRCEGSACPNFDAASAEVKISGTGAS